MRLRAILIVIIIIVCLVAGAVALVLFKQAQDQTLAQFGAKAVAMCDNLDPDMDDKGDLADIRAKLAIINASTQITADDMFNALPADNRAQNEAELTGVVCITTGSEIYDTDTYGSGEVEKYTCTRYRSTTTAYVFDIKSGDLIAKRSFDGDKPEECPERTNKSLSKYGSAPNPQVVVDWLMG